MYTTSQKAEGSDQSYPILQFLLNRRINNSRLFRNVGSGLLGAAVGNYLLGGGGGSGGIGGGALASGLGTGILNNLSNHQDWLRLLESSTLGQRERNYGSLTGWALRHMPQTVLMGDGAAANIARDYYLGTPRASFADVH